MTLTERLSFSAAILGLPKLLKDDDIHAEYPSDTDDEYVTEKGFQPCLPGEHTRLSSALALFKGTRILAKVLERNYPAATSHELSLQQMAALEAELDDWCDNLPQHLKLTFRQDKPSTDVTGSRSPLLVSLLAPTAFDLKLTRDVPGPCVLLHENPDLSACCGVQLRLQGSAGPHFHQ